jgi:DNA-binding transcriptional MerR regulator
MSAQVVIGDFSVMTSLSEKALRHYHDLGLLVPAHIDEHSGCRFYDAGQISQAQIIRRFRSMKMQIADLKALLSTDDLNVRNEIITAHLNRMQHELRETQNTAAALRELLVPTSGRMGVEVRALPVTAVWAITTTVELAGLGTWFDSALRELSALVRATGVTLDGAPGALYDRELFSEGVGSATMFLPTSAPAPDARNVRAQVLPATHVAVATHPGASHADIDRTYGALGAHVAEHLIGRDGAIREHYINPAPGNLAQFDRTEICWPILETTSPLQGDEPDLQP